MCVLWDGLTVVYSTNDYKMNSTKVQNPWRYGGAHSASLKGAEEYTTHDMKNVHRTDN